MGRMNHNVKLALWWSLLENCSASVRSGDVLSALLFLLTGSNTTVGLVQGANGVMQMLAALPAGWAADRHRRDTMLRCGAVVGAAAGVLLGYALALQPTVWMLAAASALLGCYRGIYSAALEAIWADSIATGRSSLYTKRYALTVVSSSFGPWLSLALFHFLGNQWHAHDCRLVLGSGLLLMVAPLALMCCFDDDQTLEAQQLRARQATGQQGGQQLEGGQHSGGQRQLEGGPAALPACADGELAGCRDSGSNAGVPPAGSAPAAEVAEAAETGAAGSLLAVAANGHASCPPSEACTGSDGALPVAAAAGRAAVQPAAATVLGAAGPSASDLLSLSELGGQAKAQGQHGAAGCCAWLPPGLAVTVLISCSDFIGALASGMTIKFFAMWFMQEVGLRPTAVSLIGALSPLGVSAASLACQPLSKRVGRVQISLCTRSLDIALLIWLAYLPTGRAHGLLVAVHLLRMAVANATRPLMRSVLMDCVPRRHRGKVNAVDSVRTFSWSGSAALGGFLIERFGFQRTFLITAGIKLLAFLPLFPLLAFVPDGLCIPAGTRAERLRRQQEWAAAAPSEAEQLYGLARTAAASAHASAERDSLQQPLLADRPP